MEQINICDKCQFEMYSMDLIWITSEDFKPKKNEIVPKELFNKFDALCPKCYKEEIKVK